jgi:hypothetical protein
MPNRSQLVYRIYLCETSGRFSVSPSHLAGSRQRDHPPFLRYHSSEAVSDIEIEQYDWRSFFIYRFPNVFHRMRHEARHMSCEFGVMDVGAVEAAAPPAERHGESSMNRHFDFSTICLPGHKPKWNVVPAARCERSSRSVTPADISRLELA